MPFQFLFEPFFRDGYNENTLSSDEGSYSRALTARLGKRVRELGKGRQKLELVRKTFHWETMKTSSGGFVDIIKFNSFNV